MHSDCTLTFTHTGVHAIPLTCAGFMKAQTQASLLHVHSPPSRPSKPWNPGPHYNYKADEHMATKWSQDGSDTEWCDRGNDLKNKEADLGEQVQESATGPHARPWRTFWSSWDTLEMLWCCAASLISREFCMCAWLCVSMSCSKADVSSGEETLEIGYCITGAIYLFWGLTYLIPPLNPVGVNSLAFQVIWLSVTHKESRLPRFSESGFSIQVVVQLWCFHRQAVYTVT